MTKWSEATSLADAQAWIHKETERLGKLASRKGTIAGKRLDELKMKQNVSGDLCVPVRFFRLTRSLFCRFSLLSTTSSPRPRKSSTASRRSSERTCSLAPFLGQYNNGRRLRLRLRERWPSEALHYHALITTLLHPLLSLNLQYRVSALLPELVPVPLEDEGDRREANGDASEEGRGALYRQAVVHLQ